MSSEGRTRQAEIALPQLHAYNGRGGVVAERPGCADAPQVVPLLRSPESFLHRRTPPRWLTSCDVKNP